MAFNTIGAEDVDVHSDDSTVDNNNTNDEDEEDDDEEDDEGEQSYQISDGKAKRSQDKETIATGIQYMITHKMRSALQGELGYLKEEVDAMQPQVASVVIERRLVRPLKGMPAAWRRNNTDMMTDSLSTPSTKNGSSSSIVVKPMSSAPSMAKRRLRSPFLYVVAGAAVLWLFRGFILSTFRQTSYCCYQ